jgi:NADH-quinone oxidoreductase subunit M
LRRFALSVPLYTGFDSTTADMQFQERAAWIESLPAYYHLGIDGIALPLILLTTFMTALVVVAGWRVITSRWGSTWRLPHHGGVMVGVFASLDALLFYVFWKRCSSPCSSS